MKTRTEHLEWCKVRAMEYVEAGDYQQAITSIISDLGKHPETAGHTGIQLGTLMLMAGLLNTRSEVTHFIQGFN